jgi:hypothetical protein
MKLKYKLQRYGWLALASLLGGCNTIPGGLGGLLPPWLNGSGYRYLGVANYAQKALLGTDGEFDAITMSPSGQRVVFRGRESTAVYEIFTAEVSGAIRKVAATGLEPSRFAWSSDEKSLMYQSLDPALAGQPVAIGSTPSGESIHVVTIADGIDRKILDVAGRSVFFPSPTLDQLAIFGGTSSPLQNGPFNLFDVATVTPRPLAGDIGEMHRINQASWRPDGKQLVVLDGDRVVSFSAPDWQQVTTIAAGLTVPLFWQPDGRSLKSYSFSANGDLAVLTLAEGGPVKTEVTIPMPAAPANFRWLYGAYGSLPPLPCPDGRRLLLRRSAESTLPHVSALVEPSTTSEVNLLIDLETKNLDAVAAGLTPIAWIDAQHLLAYAGRDQAKRLSVIGL